MKWMEVVVCVFYIAGVCYATILLLNVVKAIMRMCNAIASVFEKPIVIENRYQATAKKQEAIHG